MGRRSDGASEWISDAATKAFKRPTELNNQAKKGLWRIKTGAVYLTLTTDIKTNIITIKPVVWLADSREQLSGFPDLALRVAGFELWEVQQGKEPSDWKPMPSVGLGVREIRVRAGGAFRVFYVARFAEAVYVLHAFQKKAQKTPKPDIELARSRFRALILQRKQP